jgi:hypothetical protein
MAIARLAAAIAILVLFAAACGSDDEGATNRGAGEEPTAQASGDPSTDKLAQVLARAGG